jgi:hypothetical protein
MVCCDTYIILTQFRDVKFEGTLFDQWEGFMVSISGNTPLIFSLMDSVWTARNSSLDKHSSIFH